MITNKGLIFISNVQKALEHEWFADAMSNSQIKVEFILFNSKDSELYSYIINKGFTCKNYSLGSKYLIPFYVIFFWIKLLFGNYNFVHCHLMEASLIGIIAAKMAGVKKRIYTRHHSDLHHTYFPHAVKYDQLINNYATHIVATSKGVQEILIQKEHVSEKKVFVIPHGIPVSEMEKVVGKNEVSFMKEKYALNERGPIIGVVSRFTGWKGVQFIIPAFKSLLQKHPKAKLVLANAKGDNETEITKLLNELPPGSFVPIPFENNMPALFSTFDVFVHAPIDKYCEAFGQVYIETMNYGVPMVCTISGVANDLVIHEKNALVVNYKSSKEIEEACDRLIGDHSLREEIVKNATIALKEYSFEKKMQKLLDVYRS